MTASLAPTSDDYPRARTFTHSRAAGEGERSQARGGGPRGGRRPHGNIGRDDEGAGP
jgi:hypothetical protein